MPRVPPSIMSLVLIYTPGERDSVEYGFLSKETTRKARPGVRFLKLPKTFRARKAILCAGYLPKQIQFSFVLKAAQ